MYLRIITLVTLERFGVDVFVAYMSTERVPGRTSHVTVTTLVEVNVTPHVILQQAYVWKMFVAVTALEL